MHCVFTSVETLEDMMVASKVSLPGQSKVVGLHHHSLRCISCKKRRSQSRTVRFAEGGSLGCRISCSATSEHTWCRLCMRSAVSVLYWEHSRRAVLMTSREQTTPKAAASVGYIWVSFNWCIQPSNQEASHHHVLCKLYGKINCLQQCCHAILLNIAI